PADQSGNPAAAQPETSYPRSIPPSGQPHLFAAHARSILEYAVHDVELPLISLYARRLRQNVYRHRPDLGSVRSAQVHPAPRTAASARNQHYSWHHPAASVSVRRTRHDHAQEFRPALPNPARSGVSRENGEPAPVQQKPYATPLNQTVR